MTNRKTWARDALISLLLAAGYMLIFAYNNTPLGAAIGSDNAMYLTMGTRVRCCSSCSCSRRRFPADTA